MHCPHCRNQQIVKNGKHHRQDGTAVQNYLCKACGKRFSERTGTPMVRLRTPSSIVSFTLKMRTEGMGIRAAQSGAGEISGDDDAMGTTPSRESTGLESSIPGKGRGYP